MRAMALASAAFSLAASTSAAEMYKLDNTAKAGKERPIAWYFRNLRANCETTGMPEIHLNIPPKGGAVCMRSEIRPVRNIWYGENQHCIGTRVLGVRVIYIPFG